jgi:hypothetical protein
LSRFAINAITAGASDTKHKAKSGAQASITAWSE